MTDSFYYDKLRQKDGSLETLRVRSMVGLSALFGALTMTTSDVSHAPQFVEKLEQLAEVNNEQVEFNVMFHISMVYGCVSYNIQYMYSDSLLP